MLSRFVGRFGGLFVALIATPTFAQGNPSAATQPVAAATQEWDQTDQRLVFLTTELSSTEASIAVLNKAIVQTGYQRNVKAEAVTNYTLGNEMMDRRGGGPVSWDQFYGNTARSFYAPTSTGSLAYRKGPQWVGTSLNVDVATGYHPLERPKQFDFIYQANSEAQKRTEREVAQLGNKVDALLERRRRLEAEQSALWCKIAFEGLAARDLDAQPLYHFALKSSAHAPNDADTQRLDAIRAAAFFLRTGNSFAQRTAKAVDGDQTRAYEVMQKAIAAARADFQAAVLAQSTLAQAALDNNTDLGKCMTLAKRLDEVTANINDALRLSLDRDAADEDTQKNLFRGALQGSLLHYGEGVLKLDEAITALASPWQVIPDIGGHPPEVKLPAIETPPPAPTPAAVAASPSPVVATPLPQLGPVAPGSVTASHASRIDLLAMADPQQDAVHGTWTLKSSADLQEDGVQSDNAKNASLEFPYEPLAEYDMIAVFSPRDTRDCVNLIAVQNGHPFQLNIASMNKWSGLDSVRGQRAFDSANPTRTATSLQSNQWYTLILHVRHDHIRATLNGQTIVDYATDGDDFSLVTKWQLRHQGALGIQSCQTPTLFTTVQVIELSGPGKSLRGAPQQIPDSTTGLPDGRWIRRWTERGEGEQVYTIYDSGRRLKAFSYDGLLTLESDGTMDLARSRFFQTFTRSADRILVREWHTQADRDQGKEPVYIGVFDAP